MRFTINVCASTMAFLVATSALGQWQSSPCLSPGYMPSWSAKRFGEAERCGEGTLPVGVRYAAAVVAARHRDRIGLEQVLSCSYGRLCDGANSEIHSGVVQQLLLAWGDVDFSTALATVMKRHHNRYPHFMSES